MSRMKFLTDDFAARYSRESALGWVRALWESGRSVEPLSCSMWSEPMPTGGLRGPLVVVDNSAALSSDERDRLRGAFILTVRAGAR